MELMREMEFEREVEQEREVEYDVEEERRRFEELMKECSTEEMLVILKQKFNGDDRKLRVYIDRENDKYYIDTFAAYSLGLISYVKARKDVDYGKSLFEISDEMLEMLEKVFKGRIEYMYLKSKKKDAKYSINLGDNYNELGDKMNNGSFDDNNYDNFKNDDLEKIFEGYNDLNSFDSEFGEIKNNKK